MAKKISAWTLLPQKKKGTYRFNGALKISRTIRHFLSVDEILVIYNIVKTHLMKVGGQGDFIFILERKLDGKRQRVVVIDELSQGMKDTGDYAYQDDYCTIKFDYEYFD